MVKAACVHYWEVPSPNGPESLGVCRLCGEERMFPNWDEREGRPRWRTRKPKA